MARVDATSQKIQLMLKALGYNVGTLDGVLGRNSANAISAFQNDYGLYASGQADQETSNALNDAFQQGSITVYGDVLQLMLHYAGYPPGSIDGVIGRNTKNACYNFQNDQGLDATGDWDDDTIIALKSALWSGDNY